MQPAGRDPNFPTNKPPIVFHDETKRFKSDEKLKSGHVCARCGTTESPEWRHPANGDKAVWLCNKDALRERRDARKADSQKPRIGGGEVHHGEKRKHAQSLDSVPRALTDQEKTVRQRMSLDQITEKKDDKAEQK